MVLPDVSDLRSVAELPAIRGFVLPADISWVLPEQLHLSRCVSSVPQGVPQELSWSSPRLYRLQHGHRDQCIYSVSLLFTVTERETEGKDL